MIIDLPKNDAWTKHMTARFADARAIGLVETEHLELSQAFCFVPDELTDDAVREQHPAITLRELMRRSIKDAGWVRRDDLFDEIAGWLKQSYGESRLCLVCEAGFSRAGDSVLAKRPYFLLQGSPMLWSRISAATCVEIAQLLRWSRSLREVGVLAELATNGRTRVDNKKLFICDIFDGDSLACCPVS